jgi:hypothetical protein
MSAPKKFIPKFKRIAESAPAPAPVLALAPVIEERLDGESDSDSTSDPPEMPSAKPEPKPSAKPESKPKPKPKTPLRPLEDDYIKSPTPEKASALLKAYAEHKMAKCVAHYGDDISLSLPLADDGKWRLTIVRKGSKVRPMLTDAGKAWVDEQLEEAGITTSTRYCV